VKPVWPRRRLTEVAQLVGGSTPARDTPEYWGGDIPWVTPTDLPMPGEGIASIAATAQTITRAGLDSCAAVLVPPGTVLFSSRATIGKLAVAEVPLATNQGFANFIPRSIVTPRFLAYALWFHMEDIAQLAGSTTFKEVSRGRLANFEIPLPPRAKQEHIIRILDAAEVLRRLRAQADRRTADLIPALFFEMFGDPVTNPRKWKTFPVENLFPADRSGARCGPFRSALKKHEYVDAGIPVWGIENVQPNRFVEEGSLFIAEEKYAQLTNYTVQAGDILISRAGTVGRMCVARPQQSPSIIGTNLIRLALDSRTIQPEYFTSMFTYFGEQMGRLRANVDEGAYSFMNTTTLKSLTISLPPLPLQRQFAARVVEIRALEARQAESRRRLDDLFQSLLHRAFRGDL